MASISELDADVLAPSPHNMTTTTATGDAATAATATGDAATAATCASGAAAATIPRTMTKSSPANQRFL